MQCHICYKAIDDGDLNRLRACQKQCNQYHGNQCTLLPTEGTLGDKAMKSTLLLFPQVLKGKLPTLSLIAMVFLAGMLMVTYGYPETHTYHEEDVRQTLIVYDLTNRELVQLHNTNATARTTIELVRRAETVDLDTLPSLLEDDPDILIRLHGYVTSMQTDFLFGSYITVSEHRELSVSDMRIHFDNTSARVGDEVILFLIPVFVGNDTPLQSWEWAQIQIP